MRRHQGGDEREMKREALKELKGKRDVRGIGSRGAGVEVVSAGWVGGGESGWASVDRPRLTCAINTACHSFIEWQNVNPVVVHCPLSTI